MSRTRSRSDSIREDEELRLPRAPGMLRRFWARHPVVADVVITALCLLLSLVASTQNDLSVPQPWATILAVLAPVALTVGCATLLWRRRAPLVGVIAAFSLELLFLLGMSGGTPLVLVTCYALAVYGSSRAAWTALGIGTGVVAALALVLMLTQTVSVQTGVNSILNGVVLGLIGTSIGVNVGERKRYLAAIIDRSRQLLVERDQQAQLAAAAERARIAREMHDIVSHSLTVIVALSEGAAATPDREQARAAAMSAAETARGALAEMRSMLGVLRDPDSPLPLAPMQPAPPRDTVSAGQRAGYPVSLAVSGDDDVSPAVAHAVGRIVQEGVTNAMRHAPAASVIAVRLAYEADTVTIEIVNDGVTGQPGSGGFGIQGLAERAAHVNGRIESGPDDSGRWVLHAVLPKTGAPPSRDHHPTEDAP